MEIMQMIFWSGWLETMINRKNVKLSSLFPLHNGRGKVGRKSKSIQDLLLILCDACTYFKIN